MSLVEVLEIGGPTTGVGEKANGIEAAPGPRRARGAARRPASSHSATRSARPRVIAAAAGIAAERGYERLRLTEITAEAKISHQAFYGHFANKRQAVAAATSDDLGTIVELAMRGSNQGERWAARMLEDIDRTLAATYPTSDGPESRLRERITEATATEGGFNALRIVELIRVSKLGHGEFYRRYGGKRGCLQRIYADALAEIRWEAGADSPLAAIGMAIASDPERARLLVRASTHLSRQEDVEGEASRHSLLELLRDAVASTPVVNPADRRVSMIAGSALELIRSAVLADQLGRLADELSTLQPTLVRGPAPRALQLSA